jgi:hypothetical protein
MAYFYAFLKNDFCGPGRDSPIVGVTVHSDPEGTLEANWTYHESGASLRRPAPRLLCIRAIFHFRPGRIRERIAIRGVRFGGQARMPLSTIR